LQNALAWKCRVCRMPCPGSVVRRMPSNVAIEFAECPDLDAAQFAERSVLAVHSVQKALTDT